MVDVVPVSETQEFINTCIAWIAGQIGNHKDACEWLEKLYHTPEQLQLKCPAMKDLFEDAFERLHPTDQTDLESSLLKSSE